MPKLFITGILLFLLLAAAGSSQTAQARYIPWDCSDWQALAHSDRATAILESLAENRGKTLYCGIDQSDTFAKAETWEAGRDHNERDDTVYQGERGRFRGFIAAQEGWLTDGESGITGQSIAHIFEFPKEERVIRRTKRFSIASEGFCPDLHPDDEETNPSLGTLACSEWSSVVQYGGESNPEHARRIGRARLTNEIRQDSVSRNQYDPWTLSWDTFPSAAYWQDKAEVAAKSACRARGGQSVSNVVFGQGHNDNQGSGTNDRDRGVGLGWFFWDNPRSGFQYHTRQSRTWTATCIKKIRRTR